MDIQDKLLRPYWEGKALKVDSRSKDHLPQNVHPIAIPSFEEGGNQHAVW